MLQGFWSEHLLCTRCSLKRLKHITVLIQVTVGYEEINMNILQSIFLQPTFALKRLPFHIDKPIIVVSFPLTQALEYKHPIEARSICLPKHSDSILSTSFSTSLVQPPVADIHQTQHIPFRHLHMIQHCMNTGLYLMLQHISIIQQHKNTD